MYRGSNSSGKLILKLILKSKIFVDGLMGNIIVVKKNFTWLFHLNQSKRIKCYQNFVTFFNMAKEK